MTNCWNSHISSFVTPFGYLYIIIICVFFSFSTLQLQEGTQGPHFIHFCIPSCLEPYLVPNSHSTNVAQYIFLWSECPPGKFTCGILTPQSDDIGNGAFKRWWGPYGISALTKKSPKTLLKLLHHVGYNEKTAIYEPSSLWCFL